MCIMSYYGDEKSQAQAERIENLLKSLIENGEISEEELYTIRDEDIEAFLVGRDHDCNIKLEGGCEYCWYLNSLNLLPEEEG